MNCELNHVDVVLCCDPKAFTHTNPLEGLKKGGALVWESSESPETAWQRIPAKYRQFIQDNNIRIFILPGFDIARKATNQTRAATAHAGQFLPRRVLPRQPVPEDLRHHARSNFHESRAASSTRRSSAASATPW